MTSGYHERQDDLSESTLDLHRALSSLMEELEAVDWYQQRIDATADPALKEVLAHNRDEEIEHAAMVLEWLRRNNAKFDEELRRVLFTSGPITAAEENGGGAGSGSLGLGKLTASGPLAGPALPATDTPSFTGFAPRDKEPSDESSE